MIIILLSLFKLVRHVKVTYLWKVSENKAMRRFKHRTADKKSQVPTKMSAMMGSIFFISWKKQH